ncbi:MAG TPA: type II toxin-antitoxin system HicA family toxin [Blastocatellia bacterium]|nr:type II toxin-antitoxin system HicA family toxin [Blastocatellia bacterium]
MRRVSFSRLRSKELIRHLAATGCEFPGEGSDHTVYVNRHAQKTSTIPGHREINDFLARNLSGLTGS